MQALQTRSALRDSRFAMFFVGQGISNIGNQAFSLAMYWFVQMSTGEPALVAWLAAAQFAPQIIAVLVGPYADRYDRRRLLIATDIFRGVVVGYVAVLSYFHTNIIVTLFVVVVLLGLSTNLFESAVFGFVPDIVPSASLLSANSLIGASTKLAVVLGSALGAVLLAQLGPRSFLLFDALTFGVSVLTLYTIRSGRGGAPPDPPTTYGARRWLHELGMGLREVSTNRLTRYLYPAFFLSNVFLVPFSVLLPSWAHADLHTTAAGYSAMELLWAAGAVVGATLAPKLSERLGFRALLASSFVLQAVLVLFTVESTLLWSAAVLFVFGAANSVSNALLSVVMQRLFSADMLGRVTSIALSVNGSGTPIGAALAGALVPFVGVTAILIVAGVGTGLVWSYVAIAASRSWHSDDFSFAFAEQ